MTIEQSGPIDGSGVVLVPVAADRVDAVLAGDIAPYVAGPGWPHNDTPAALSFRAVQGMTWLITLDGIVVGDVGTKGPPDVDGRVEIGYGLAVPSRGQGLGTRAVGVLVDWLLARDDVCLVMAHVNPANVPSARLLLRLGFRQVAKAGDEDVYAR